MFDRELAQASRVAAAGGRAARRITPNSPRLLLSLLAALLALACWGGANGLGATGASARVRPVLGHHGLTLKWTTAGRRGVYELMVVAGHRKRIVTVTGATTIRLHQRPGSTAVYRVKAAYNESRWSNSLMIHYRARGLDSSRLATPRGLPGGTSPSAAAQIEGAGQEVPPEPLPGNMFVGVSAGGWGPSAWPDVAGAARYVRMASRFATDAEVGGAAAADVGVATWIFGEGGSIGAINPTAYAAEIVSVFKRFGRGGTFWRGRRRDLGSRAVEVLNEPGNPGFWRDPTNYSAYVNLLRTVHAALAANFPEAIRPRVLASWDGGEGPSSAFGPGWKALGGLAYCDAVTVHPYGGRTGGDGGALGGHEDVELAHAASGMPVYVTEVGWPTAVGQASTGDSQQWTESQQAENITNFVRWARSTQYVATVLIFNFVDYGSNTWYGIERADRSHKPSYSALSKA